MNAPYENFTAAFLFTLKNEGGYVNNLGDSGGPTNMGVTQHTLSLYRGEPVSAEDVQSLTMDEVKQIYFWYYWRTIGCDKVTSEAIATCLFDTAVLYGTRVSTRLAQKTLITCGHDIEVDGHIGPVTTAALNAVDARAFVCAFHAHILVRIDEVIDLHPKYEMFRKGWTKRAVLLLSLA